jgi:hypothetical protein
MNLCHSTAQGKFSRETFFFLEKLGIDGGGDVCHLTKDTFP